MLLQFKNIACYLIVMAEKRYESDILNTLCLFKCINGNPARPDLECTFDLHVIFQNVTTLLHMLYIYIYFYDK